MGRIAALVQGVRAQAVVIGPGADGGTHLCPGHWRRLPQPLKGAVLRAIAAANRQEADR